MADRFRTVNQPNPPRSRATAPQSQPAQPAIRRNIFQNGGGPNARAARRPAPTSTTSAETILDVEVSDPDSSEIVVRNRHGEVEIGDSPPPDLDDPAEEDDEGKQEMEQERQRLSEAVKQHHDNTTNVPDQPEELLEAVRASLRAKVAALSEDNWMYETEDSGRT